jgi:hypothetical protein
MTTPVPPAPQQSAEVPGELTDEQILAALGSITHEVPKRLPPGWLKFARAIEREVRRTAASNTEKASEE